MKHYMFIGRYQPFHNAHKYLIDTVLNRGKRVCVAIMDTEVNDQNPYPAFVRVIMISKVYEKEIAEGKLKVIVIPPVEEVCTGRNVGYTIVDEPQEFKMISATDIRQKLSDQLPDVVKETIKNWENWNEK